MAQVQQLGILKHHGLQHDNELIMITMALRNRRKLRFSPRLTSPHFTPYLTSHRSLRSKADEAAGEAFDDPMASQFKTMYRPGQGKQITWGIFQTDVPTPKKANGENMSFAEFAAADSAERQQLRATAAQELTNIGAEERGRRYKAGVFFGALAVALGVFQVSTGAPPLQRAAMALPLFFTLGFTGSGATGL